MALCQFGGVLQAEFLYKSRGKFSSLSRLDQVYKGVPSLADLLAPEVSETHCLFEFVFVEHGVSSIRSDPKIEVEVNDRLERGRIRAFPSHGLQDVGVVPCQGSIRTIEPTDIEGLVFEGEPHRPVARVQNYFTQVFHGL